MKKTFEELKPFNEWTQWEHALCSTVVFACAFDLEDFAVELFRYSPLMFGMDKYPYPDIQKARCIIYGPRGLEGRGLLLRIGRCWELTSLAWQVRAELLTLADQFIGISRWYPHAQAK